MAKDRLVSIRIGFDTSMFGARGLVNLGEAGDGRDGWGMVRM